MLARNSEIKFDIGKLAPLNDDDRIVSMVIPFSGFYESIHSSNIDQDESETENLYDNLPEYAKRDYETENETIGAREFIAELLRDNLDYTAAKKYYTAEYVEAFFDRVEGETDYKVNYETEALSSPREYNFTTDRIFVNCRLSDIQHMYAELMTDDDGKALKTVIKEKFTSRDGFCSFYRTDFEVWTDKIANSWDLDHNEFGTIFEAWLSLKIDDVDNMEMETSCYDMSEAGYMAYSEGIDWKKVETAIEEFKADKLKHALIENPSFVPRCEDTINMKFEGLKP